MASCDVPMDVIKIIISRLPAKSLLRFRCVCKSWHDFISSPEFIKLHRDNKFHGHVLMQHGSAYSVHSDDKTFMEQGRFLLPCPILRTHGYCNGLVCLSTSEDELNLHLWNPSIRKFKTLPKPLLNMRSRPPVIVAFCFVPRINDYRLLRTVNNSRLNDGAKSAMYSLHNNSWKLVENMLFHQVLDSSISTVVNGVIYFMAFETDSYVEEILIAFDMADEVFTTINIAGVITGRYFSSQGPYPVFFGTSLFIIDVQEEANRIGMSNEDTVDVYERKVHDGTKSWTKKLTIDEWLQPVGILKDGEMVCRHGDGRISSYDPRRIPEIKDLPFPRISQRVNIITYFVETLMLLDEGNSLVS